MDNDALKVVLEEHERWLFSGSQAGRRAEQAYFIAKDADPLLRYRADWRLHCILMERNPLASDKRRLSRLRRLYNRFREQVWIDEIREFKERYGKVEQG